MIHLAIVALAALAAVRKHRRSAEPEGLELPKLPASVEPFASVRVDGMVDLLAYSRAARNLLLRNMDRAGWVVQSIEGAGVFFVGPGDPRSMRASDAIRASADVAHVWMSSQGDGEGTLIQLSPPNALPGDGPPLAVLPAHEHMGEVAASIHSGAHYLLLLSPALEIL